MGRSDFRNPQIRFPRAEGAENRLLGQVHISVAKIVHNKQSRQARIAYVAGAETVI